MKVIWTEFVNRASELWRKMWTRRGLEVLFTVIGTAIVLFSFYEREVRKEEAKDLSGTIEWAQSTVSLRKAIRSVQETVDAMKDRVEKADRESLYYEGVLGTIERHRHEDILQLEKFGRVRESLLDTQYLVNKADGPPFVLAFSRPTILGVPYPFSEKPRAFCGGEGKGGIN